MHHERLITGVAATLGTIALVLTVVGVTGSPLALPVAAAFAASALLMYDQLSGRMAARVYDRVERAARVNGAADAGGSSRQRRSRRERQRRGRRRARDDDRGDAGAGPREEWRPPRNGATAREAAAGQGAAGRGRRSRAGGGAASGRRSASDGRSVGGRAGAGRSANGQPAEDRMPAAVAYRRLDLDPGADDEAVKRAYREKVKEVHPDTGDGDEDEFMAVKEAYERLRD